MDGGFVRKLTRRSTNITPRKEVSLKDNLRNASVRERIGRKLPASRQSFSNVPIELPLIPQSRLNSTVTCFQDKASAEVAGFDAIAQVQAVPLTSQIVIKQFGNYLSKYELGEIIEYRDVHFFAMKANKIKSNSKENNFGFDNENSDYRVVIGDHLAYRYEMQQIIGKGAFSQVVLCFDHKFKEPVAIKIIRNQPRYLKQGRIEVKILSDLKSQSNETHTVTMLDSFVFRRHLCISFETLGINLYEQLKLNSFHGLPLPFLKTLSRQLLTCLKTLDEKNIIHCDLKPENILLKQGQRANIKVIDFGSSCYINEKVHTYIQSRFYRAPEVILGVGYSKAIDMWSFGCILAEMHLGRPLFPGESEIELLMYIAEVKGMPGEAVLEKAAKNKCFFEGGQLKLVGNLKTKKKISGIKGMLKRIDPQLYDFLDKCLEWDPEKRITPIQALNHEWLTAEQL
jgi:dual specificity tyrosine-phosphorylation-regulated kinase 2/3/4